MEPTRTTLRMYTRPSTEPALDWAWVDAQLTHAELYWVAAETTGHPHPRPVWGVWDDGSLHLSIGTPALLRALAEGLPVTVHLDSGVDVVIVEGSVTGQTGDPAVIGAYDTKYDFTYDLEQYGPFVTMAAETVLAWRAAGPAGRDGFVATGRWTYG